MITLRSATLDDAATLFAWRNDPLTRKNSRNNGKVRWENHLSWLSATLKRDDRIFLIGECDGRPIGTVRFDKYSDYYEISWTGAPEVRGRGYAKEMAVKACSKVKGVPIIAEIKADNAPSINMIKACGFSLTKEENGVSLWRRESACS